MIRTRRVPAPLVVAAVLAAIRLSSATEGVFVNPPENEWPREPDWVRADYPIRLQPMSGNVALLLEKAAQGPYGRAACGRWESMQVDLGLIDGRWDTEAWAYGYFLTKKYDYEGVVLEAADKDGAIELEAVVNTGKGSWAKQDVGVYRLKMRKQGRCYEGTFEGDFQGQAVKGKAYGVYCEPAPKTPGYRPRSWSGDDMPDQEAKSIVAAALTKINVTAYPAWSNHAAGAIAQGGLAVLKFYGSPGPFTDPDPGAEPLRKRVYAARRKAWEAGGKRDPAVHRAITLAVRRVTRCINMVAGSGGFLLEGDMYSGNVTIGGICGFVQEHRLVTGSEHSRTMTNLKWAPFYEVARTVWRKPAALPDWAKEKAALESDQGAYMVAGGYGAYAPYPMSSEAFPMAAGLCDSPYVSALLEHARRRGMTVKPEWVAAPGSEPKPVAEIMPRVIVDRQKGGYIFRNAYKDVNDIIFMAYAQCEEIGSCWTLPHAGGYRIMGLGTRWVMHSGRWKWRWLREDENCVLVPEAPRGWFGATPTWFEGHPDGSGSVTLNMDRTYRRTAPYGDAYPFGEPPGQTAGEDAGVRGLRALAVDYSGKCGAGPVCHR